MPIALEFFVHYAYGIVFLWVLIEQLGVPIPSAPMLLTAGTLSATHRIQAIPLMGAILLACALADSLWYFAGVRYGGRVVRLVCRFSLEASSCVKKTEGYFSRHGAMTLVFAKFIPGLSALAPPIAGQTGMPFSRFLALDMVGSALWGMAFVFGGRFFGDLAERSAMLIHVLTHYGLILFVLLIFAILGVRLYRQRAFLHSVRSMRLDAEELKNMLDDAKEHDLQVPFIVDLRHPLDYLPDPRVLPGAIRIGPKELEQHAEVLPRDRDIVLYCTCPSEETSAALALRLHKLGIYRVRPLKGGFEGWRDAGYPLIDYEEPVVAIIPAV
jgi:membrane protein DedA with SNARE-associated domain